MTDLFFPDESQFNGEQPVWAHAEVYRAGEGDWLVDSLWTFNQAKAEKAGIPYLSYWFLEDGSSGAAQASKAFGVVGPDVPLMLDIEPIIGGSSVAAARAGSEEGHYCGSAWRDLQTWINANTPGVVPSGGPSPQLLSAAIDYISKPSLTLACAFIDAYRSLGGIIHVAYLPRWYWQVLGSPSLQPLADRRMILHSSDYTTYSDTGPGWQSYGGMTPMFWQYTDSGPGNQDWNAYRSAVATVDGAVAELKSLWHTGSLLSGYREWDTKGKRSLGEVADACGMTPSNVLADTVKHYGGFDPVVAAYLDDVFSRITTKIPAGGRLRVRA